MGKLDTLYKRLADLGRTRALVSSPEAQVALRAQEREARLDADLYIIDTASEEEWQEFMDTNGGRA